jgi:hypothetical protein
MKHELAIEDALAILAARREFRQQGFFACGCCGRLLMYISRDTGFSPAWIPASMVTMRLLHNERITGELGG